MLGAERDQFFHDAPLLIHFDRVDAAELAVVAVGGARSRERLRDAIHARGQNVREAQQHRRAQASLPQVLDEGRQLDGRAALAARPHFECAVFIDAEKSASPVLNVVELEAVADGPSVHFFWGATSPC